MPAVVVASVPSKVQGLPQTVDNFPRRFRNKAPLAIRQIISHNVLKQWATDPEHVAQALNQSVLEQGSGPKQDQHTPQQQGPAVTVTSISPDQPAQLSENDDDEQPLLQVMVAEDTKNFMDNPQFTKKISMTARQIVARVIVAPSTSSLSPQSQLQSAAGSEIEGKIENTEGVSADVLVPDLHIKDAQTSSNTTTAAEAGPTIAAARSSSCPLCENQVNQQADFHNGAQDLRRFYYRGTVPSSLYSALEIPALLSSLSLPLQSTAFASAPNKDLMRIWVSLAGATTPLHYDQCHGILIQLVGRKRFVVFSHEDTNNLYPYDGLTGPGHASKIRGLGHCFPSSTSASVSASASATGTGAGKESTQRSPERLLSPTSFPEKDNEHLKENMMELMERWPKVRNTDPWVIDLEPGDALYTPPGFWHEVTSVDNSISITVAWDMDATELEHVPRHMAF